MHEYRFYDKLYMRVMIEAHTLFTKEWSMKEIINETLDKYISDNPYPWHMPGHKRSDCYGSNRWAQMFAYDFTEAEGLDDMHKPQSFIKESMQSLRNIYGTHKTYMLVNGATSGILAAIHATCRQGSYILMGRNCHKSVYHAVNLLRLHPVYFTPEMVENTDIYGDITPDDIREHLIYMQENGNRPSAVILTSPTYEGIVSDIKGIADVLKQFDIPLIVDQAHGAHFTFMGDEYIPSAVANGADIVIESLHKTLPSLTQTAVVHITDSKYEKKLERYLEIFQTSSPSYLFMQSIEKAVIYCHASKEVFEKYKIRLLEFRKKCEQLQNLMLFAPEGKVYAYDIGKLVILVSKGIEILYHEKRQRMTGVLLAKLLVEEYRQVPEMAAVDYVLAMTSVMDGEEAFDKLFHALQDIDQRISSASDTLEADEESEALIVKTNKPLYPIPDMCMLPGEGWNQDSVLMELVQTEGRVAGEYIYAYPPGIPVVVPGEIISEEVIERIQHMLKEGLNVTGVYLSEKNVKIAVIGG